MPDAPDPRPCRPAVFRRFGVSAGRLGLPRPPTWGTGGLSASLRLSVLQQKRAESMQDYAFCSVSNLRVSPCSGLPLWPPPELPLRRFRFPEFCPTAVRVPEIITAHVGIMRCLFLRCCLSKLSRNHQPVSVHLQAHFNIASDIDASYNC